VPVTHPFVSGITDAGTAGIVSPDDWNANHSGSEEWTFRGTKASDQDVTNSATFVDDSDLQFSVLSGETWRVRCEIIFAGTSTAGDYKWQLAVSAGTMHGFIRYGADSDTAATGAITRAGDVSAIGSSANTDGTGQKQMMILDAVFVFSANATFSYQFAQFAAISATVARNCAGSRMYAKKLSTTTVPIGVNHSFVSSVSDGGDATLVRPSDWNAAHDGTNEWDTIVVKPSDQDVTNSNSLTDDTDLQLAVLANEVWTIRLEIIYSGSSTTGDFKCAATVSAGTMYGIYRTAVSSATNDTSSGSSTNAGDLINVSTTTSFTAGTNASDGRRNMFLDVLIRFSANGTFKFRFAQNTAVSSTHARVLAGSRLLARKLA